MSDDSKSEVTIDYSKLRMNAYYYSFSHTGPYHIDRILSAVACAGKEFHNTDMWNEECDPYYGHTGDNPVEWIQNAANDCAKVFNTAYAEGRKSMEKEFNELLEIANQLQEYQWDVWKKFDKWKKARGIA